MDDIEISDIKNKKLHHQATQNFYWSIMFVLRFHYALRYFEKLCSTQNSIFNQVTCSSKQDVNHYCMENSISWAKLHSICNLLNEKDVTNFIEYNINMKKYFFGNNCKVEYMRRAFDRDITKYWIFRIKPPWILIFVSLLLFVIFLNN